MKLIALILILFTKNTWALTFVTEDSPPFHYISDHGYPSGVSIAIIEELLLRTNIKATIKFYPWARAYKMARVLRDVCAFNTNRTEVQELNFKWVGPITSDNWSLYARGDSQIAAKSLADVSAHSIGALHEGALAQHLKDRGLKVETASSEKVNCKKLMLGRFDLWAVGSHSAKWLANNEGIYIKEVLSIRKMDAYLACNHSVSNLDIAIMNETLRKMRVEKYTDRVMDSYTNISGLSTRWNK
jgi:polar amino acid transport system substrate-binding protein